MPDEPAPQSDDTYSETETDARAAAALKQLLATPHKPQKDTKSSGLLPRGRRTKR
jgi:hypothetical protein